MLPLNLCSKASSLESEQSFTVDILFGKRNEPLLSVCARQISQHLADAGTVRYTIAKQLRHACFASFGLDQTAVDVRKFPAVQATSAQPCLATGRFAHVEASCTRGCPGVLKVAE